MKLFAPTSSAKSVAFVDKSSESRSTLQRKGYPGRISYPTASPAPKTTNTRALPENLQTGIETLSGYSMNDVRVHYNSGKASQVHASAYAQGTDIHVGPGEEKHLPHEAWHVVQQKQGRVRPTMQTQTGIFINDNVELEREADVMGTRANSALSSVQRTENDTQTKGTAGNVVQRNKLKTLKNVLSLGIRKAYVNHKRKKRAAALLQNTAVVHNNIGNPLDSFVKAYEKARYYHGSHPGNLQSLDKDGLLNYEDRVSTLGGDVRGMSLTAGGEYAGDEKKGVFLGPKPFMQENNMTQNVVRAYLGSNRTKLHHWDETDVPSQEIMRDEKFRGGAVITKDSVPASQITNKSINELLENDDPKLNTILAQVGSQYEGNAPDLEEMKGLLQQAVRERRLSNVAFDNT